MRRVHVIGRKNAGKTTLIVELVERLAAEGLKVATIKHTHHAHELDVPGKDSHRHRLAGAAAVGVLSRNLLAVYRTREEAANTDPYAILAEALGPCDLVLVEGDSSAAAPKIEVWRTAVASKPLATSLPGVAAVVSDDEVDVAIPVWPRSQIDTLAHHIRALCGLE